MAHKERRKWLNKDRILSEYLAELGRKGGKVSADRLTKQQRIERARRASHARKRMQKGRSTKK